MVKEKDNCYQFENNSLLPSFIVIVGIIIVFSVILIKSSEESLIELYFEDHTNLPSEIELDKSYPFSFSIHNLEQEKTTYGYQIYTLYNDGTTEEIDSSSITLDNEETATISEHFMIKESFETAKIVLELNTGEEIHFWITEE